MNIYSVHRFDEIGEEPKQKLKSHNLLFDVEWFLPISASDRMSGRRLMLFFLACSCWCRCLRSSASRTFSRESIGRLPALTIFSQTRSATWSSVAASISSMIVPLRMRLRNSKRECRDRVATWGFDHRFPPERGGCESCVSLPYWVNQSIFWVDH